MSTPAVRPFTDAYLLEYSGEHLAYEVDMFFEMVEVRRRRSFAGALETIGHPMKVNNALIESFAVHLRNLIDFLYLDRPHRTDVVASDFLDSGTWDALRPAISGTLEKARRRANKEIAHLTTDRILGGPPEKGLDFDALANELRPTLRLFVAKAKGTRLSQSVRAAIR